jgi:hypothetical protein
MTWKHSRSHMRNAPSMVAPNCFSATRYKSRELEGPRPQTVAKNGIILPSALWCSLFGELVRALGLGVAGRSDLVAHAFRPLEDEHLWYNAPRMPMLAQAGAPHPPLGRRTAPKRFAVDKTRVVTQAIFRGPLLALPVWTQAYSGRWDLATI